MEILDCLYGDIEFTGPIQELIEKPIVQRLRHVRMSNIDSLDMPGVANISRYEHSLGVCHLAGKVCAANKIAPDSQLILTSSALLHDCLISPFGHLVEEALAYLSVDYNHETKLEKLLLESDKDEIGGLDKQILYGRNSYLNEWSHRQFGDQFKERLLDIVTAIQGKGYLGPLIAGAIDLDNIDNVCRVAYHMGLPFDKDLPLNLANNIYVPPGGGPPQFLPNAIESIQQWLELRGDIYKRFMPAPRDFSGKVMLIDATIKSYQMQVIGSSEWNMNDIDFLGRLLNCEYREIYDTVQRWLTGEQWNISELVWMSNPAPNYPRTKEFSEILSNELDRYCLAYRIKDKRTRLIEFVVKDTERMQLGQSPVMWLLGIGSPVRKDFTRKDFDTIVRLATEFFGCDPIGSALEASDNELSLF